MLASKAVQDGVDMRPLRWNYEMKSLISQPSLYYAVLGHLNINWPCSFLKGLNPSRLIVESGAEGSAIL
jgi:hypothetical protein